MIIKCLGRIADIFNKQKVLYVSIFWGSLAGVFSQGLNFITNIFLTRFLGVKYGELVLYTSTNGMLQTFAIVGLNVLATVFVAKNLRNNKATLSKIIPNLYFFVGAMTLLVAFFAICVNEFQLFSIHFWVIKSWFAKSTIIIWFVFSTLDLLQISILLGFSAFKDVAKVSLIKGIVSIILTLIFIKFYGLSGAIYAYAISFIISFGLNFIFIKKNCLLNSLKLIHKVDLTLIIELLKVSTPIFIASFVLLPSQWGINYIIFNRDNGSLALTIFGIANQWMMLVQFFPLQISKVVLPFLTSKDNSTSDYKKTENTGLLISVLIGLSLILLIFLFEENIIAVYKIGYQATKCPFRILMVAALFSIVNLYLGQTLIASGRTWLKAFLDVVMSITLFVAFLASANFSAPVSLSIAYFASFIVASLFTLFFKQKKFNR